MTSWRRAPGLAVLLVLLSIAAFAPLIANELPLYGRIGGATSWPAFRALAKADFAWVAGFLAACAAVARRRPSRAALVACAAVALSGVAWHTQDVVLPAEAARLEGVVRTPIPFGPRNTDLLARLSAPSLRGHLFGADELGRDVAARVVYGLRLSLLVGLSATALALVLGVALGAAAACCGRVVDAAASTVILASFCLPAVFLIAALESFGRTSLFAVVAVLATLRFGTVARLVRQECRRVLPLPFVDAARGLGIHPVAVFLRHVLPHALLPATVAAAFGVSGAILAEAGLSFLGLGVPEPSPSLGRLLNDGRRAAPGAPHLVWIPGVVLLVVVLACHAIGARLRDALDPRGAEAAS